MANTTIGFTFLICASDIKADTQNRMSDLRNTDCDYRFIFTGLYGMFCIYFMYRYIFVGFGCSI